MNVTLFIGKLYGGGAERVVCSLASYLAEKGNRVRILAIAEKGKNYELSGRVEVRYLLPLKDRGNKAKNILISLPRLIRYMTENRDEDVYIVMLPLTIMLLLMLRSLTKAKIIAAERSNPSSYSGFSQKLLKRLARRADGWVFQTEDARAWYQDAIGSTPAEVIPNAVNPAFMQPPYTGERKKEIVSAGRLTAQKNFGLLIDAFAGIADRFPDYTLTIYGEGPDRKKLEEQAASLTLQDRIHLPGNVPDIAERIKKSGLFVLASNYEGMPNALMEAMALGLPCISTDCPAGGPRFLIRNGENGILVPPGNRALLSEAMTRVLENKEEARAMGIKASSLKNTLDPDRIYGRWEAFAEKAVSGKNEPK